MWLCPKCETVNQALCEVCGYEIFYDDDTAIDGKNEPSKASPDTFIPVPESKVRPAGRRILTSLFILACFVNVVLWVSHADIKQENTDLRGEAAHLTMVHTKQLSEMSARLGDAQEMNDSLEKELSRSQGLFFSRLLVQEGTLTGNDRKENGRHYDNYIIDINSPTAIIGDLQSESFDCKLSIIKIDSLGNRITDNNEDKNDDFMGRRTHSLVMARVSPGRWKLHVTSYRPGETGNYTLRAFFYKMN